MILNATLSCVAKLDPTKGMGKAEKRSVVEKYISRSYPHWDKVTYQDPLKSVEMLLNEVGEQLINYRQELHLVFEMACHCLSDKQLKIICDTTQQIIISYCVYYVHVKRDPRSDALGAMHYVNLDYLPCVDIRRWSRTYRLHLE